MGRRKVSLSRRPVFLCRRSLHSDGLAENETGRLCDRTPNGQSPPRGHAFSILVCRYDPPGNYPNQLPYPAAAPPSQAVGEEENANTESGALPIEQGAAPPGESGGGGDNNTGGGGG